MTDKGEFICKFHCIVKHLKAEFLAYASHNNIASAVNSVIGISR